MAFTPEQEAILKAIADNPGTPIDGKTAISTITGDERVPLSAGTDTGGTGPGAIDRKTTLTKIKNWIEANFSFTGVNAITFNTDPPVITDAGTILWNNKEYTIDIITGLGPTIQAGQETLLLYYNDTGGQIDNFTTLHPKSATIISGLVVPTPEKADASKWELCEGTLTVATHNIADGQLGFATKFGKARDGNSAGWTPGIQLWLTDDGSGLLTKTKPTFPSYSISMGGSLKEHATEGVIFVSITKAVGDTFNDAWDGAIRETFNFTTSSNGTIVTGLLENVDPANNLTLFFSDGAVFYTLDTTTSPLTIELTPGTDDNEQKNFIYIPIATKVLTKSTSGWPATEHCRVAELDIQSAATTQDDGGVLGNQNTNNHVKKENDNGHILHGFAWIREQFATMRRKYGSEATFDNTDGNGYIEISGGSMLQAHMQTLDSFSMVGGDLIRSWNDSSGNRPKQSNLTSITSFSDGSGWNNEWGKIVVWRVGNKTGEYSPVMYNLPSGGYNSESSAIEDLQQKADYSIPDNFITKGVLIATFTFRISGGVITYNSGVGYLDLRGSIPNNTAGGGAGSSGITTLLALTDINIPTYAGQAGKVLVVASGEEDVELLNQLTQTTIASSATPTPTGDARENEQDITALAVDSELQEPANTPANGNSLFIRIKDDDTARLLTYDPIYTGDLPTTTVVGQTLYLELKYNSTTDKWESQKKLAGTGVFYGLLSHLAQSIAGIKTWLNDAIFKGALNIINSGPNGIVLTEDTGTSTASSRVFFENDSGGNSIYRNNDILEIRTGAVAGSASGSSKFGVDDDGNIYIIETPGADATYNNNLTWNPSTKKIEQRESAYAALIPGAAVAYDLLTGLNKTLEVAVDTTITFSNPINGMPTGDIRLNVTVDDKDIILAGAGITFAGIGTLTGLSIGIYHIAFVVISPTVIDYNIGPAYT